MAAAPRIAAAIADQLTIYAPAMRTARAKPANAWALTPAAPHAAGRTRYPMPYPNTHPALAQALAAQGYEEPTPVQAAILEAPAGADLLVSAQTGSGKTVAFGLAAAAELLGGEGAFRAPGAPLGLVIAPTRELALQVARELDWLYAGAGARI